MFLSEKGLSQYRGVLANGQGRLDSIQVPHSGSYLMCAFSYESEPPERSLRSSLFNSTVISAFIRPQTTTITSGSSPTGESSARSSSNRDGPIIGGVLGGFFALLIALVLLPFWFCRYRIVRKTTNSGSNEALMSASHLEGSHMPYEPQTGGYFTYYTAGEHATSDAASSSYPPMSPPAGPSRAASEGGWGSQSGPSEAAETEIPPAYAIVSANRRVKN
ncbi:hypothetical protein VNI00_014217 [Paramarasmius palmivorus]|uniref:Uncharacterized protein n=1 Tax=Paramarasmius palmivorus TaxID=297713 RepID=A0AAW0BVP5_9AGAR